LYNFLNDDETINLDLYGDIHMYTNVIVCDILVDQCDSIWPVIPSAESFKKKKLNKKTTDSSD